MRFPFVQVAQEAWPLSRELAALLKISPREARGLLLDLWAWGLGLGPGDVAPSGRCEGQLAVQRMAGAIEWTGDPTALADALEEIGAVELGANFVRVRGVDRYARTWEKNTRRGHGKDAPGTNPATPERAPAETRQKPAVSRAPDADADADADLISYRIPAESSLICEMSPAPVQEPLALVPQPPTAATPADLQRVWSELAPAAGLRAWKGMPPARKVQAEKRLRERPGLDGPEGWRAVIQRLCASSFCRGLTGDRPWIANPTFLLRPSTATRALEGEFDDPKPVAPEPYADI